jgi:arylsulfatase A-like enzyme/tetratricopeptide (TPR) repeat protein
VILVAAAIAVGWAGWGLYNRFCSAGIRNVVLISIDTCRADRLSCYGYKRPSTPNIDAVARSGVLFQHALTPVPLTMPAHSSMFTGTYPPTHGVRLNDGYRLDEASVTLARVLHEAGYQTGAFVGGFPLDARFGLNQGFDTYDGRFTRRSEKSSWGTERTAEEVNRPALAWLQEHARKPFFLFLHYYDPHYRYSPPPPFARDYAEDLYAGEIAYVDQCVGEVLTKLRTLGADDNTLLIITGDHGESLGEHGEAKHGFFVYQSTLHVPLIIRAHRASSGRQVAAIVSLVDLMPTVLDLVGLKTPAQVEGVSLRRCLEGGPVPDRRRPVYCESLEPATFQCSTLQGLVEAGWKYIRAPGEELYDLQRDPGEHTNLAGKESQRAGRMRGRLEATLQEMDAAAPRRGAAAVDPEAVKRLQSLGYVGGGAVPSASAFDPSQEDPKAFLPTYTRFDKAANLFYANRNEEAKRELLALIESRPAFIAAYGMLAVIALEEHRLAAASEYGARIVEILSASGDAPKQRPPTTGNIFTVDLAEAHYNLANILQQMGKLAEAIGHYEQALSIRPDYIQARVNLGLALVQTGKLEEAIGHYEESLRIRPDGLEAHVNLGLALVQAGKPAEAIGHYEEALRIKPDCAEAHNNLGLALVQIGKPSEAIGHYEQALRIKPDYVEAHDHLGLVFEQAGRMAEAIGQYEQALRIRSDSLRPMNNLAWIRATAADPQLRDGAEAVRLAERACQLTARKEVVPLDSLAAAYAEARRFPEAVATAEEALARAQAVGPSSALADEIRARLTLYRAGKPYREASQQEAHP